MLLLKGVKRDIYTKSKLNLISFYKWLVKKIKSPKRKLEREKYY